MLFLRSLLFMVFINLWGVVIPIIYCPAFFSRDRRRADNGALVWSKFAIWVLEKLCKVKYEVRGLENLPQDGAFVVACKHQSMWETIIMHLIFCHPVYVYKKELLKIPFYGWYLRRMSAITLDRKGGMKAVKSLISQAKYYIDRKQIIVIFPQGTRTSAGSSVSKYPYQPGIAALYNALKVPVVPAALNSGLYWNKKQITKKPGTIILEFLPAIAPGLNREQFMESLEKQIEEKTMGLEAQGGF